MKTIILAGGQGTREKLIFVRSRWWRLVIARSVAHPQIYAHKGEHIKRYVTDYGSLAANLTVDLGTDTVEIPRRGGGATTVQFGIAPNARSSGGVRFRQ